MSLSKSKISNWIEQQFADDYFRFDLICSEVTVLSYEQDGSSLRVDYKFWDDGHSISDNQQNFLFNIKLADEYLHTAGCDTSRENEFSQMVEGYDVYVEERKKLDSLITKFIKFALNIREENKY